MPRIVASRPNGHRVRLAMLTAVALASGVLSAADGTPAAAAPPRPRPPSCPAASDPTTLTAPDEASAVARARRCDRRVEVLSHRTETVTAYARPNGRIQWTSTVTPIRVHRSDGSWAPIDTTLHAAADGSVTPGATALGVRLSGGGKGPLAVLRTGGRSLAFSWPEALPRPHLDGDTAIYPDVLPDIDLRVRVTADSVSEVLVVKTRAAAANPALDTIRLTLAGDHGLTVRQEAGRQLSVVDADGRAVFAGSAPMMWDSSGSQATDVRSRTAGPQDARRIEPLGVAADTDSLRLSPDAGMLEDPKTVYPVYVDPVWTPSHKPTAWTYVDKAYPNQQYYTHWDGAASMPVGPYPSPAPAGVHRTYLRYDTSTLAGKIVTKATLVTTMVQSWMCDGKKHGMLLYRTADISTATTWNNPPTEQQLVSTDQVGTACNGPYEVDWDALSGVQYAASQSQSTLVLEMRAPVTAENAYDVNYRKRFAFDPILYVEYDSVPAVPSGTNTSGSACVTGSGRPIVDASPMMNATFSDPDGGALVAEFQQAAVNADGTRGAWTAAGTMSVSSGTTQGLGLPGVVDNTAYAWRARATDPAQVSSAWSAPCEFLVDMSGPTLPPNVTMTDFTGPVGSPYGSVGRSSRFTFDPAGLAYSQGYDWGWSSLPAVPDSTPPMVPTASGAPATVSLTLPPPVPTNPTTGGQETLYVRMVDNAGHRGPSVAFGFSTASANPAVGSWQFAEQSGTVAADGSGAGHTMTLTGSVGHSTDGPAVGQGAITMTGTGEGDTSGPVVATDASFTVSAWVRLHTTSCSTNMAGVSEDGANVSGFILSYDCWTGHWRLRMPDQDVGWPANWVDALATTPATAGRWTHLVGVYDQSAGRLRLYQDGVLEADVAPSAAWLAGRGAGWQASGSLAVGRDRMLGANAEYLDGDVSAVRLYDRVATSEEIVGWDAPVLAGQWTFEEGGSPTFDDSGLGHDVDWSGGALPTDSVDGTGALQLDGVSGMAATTGPVIHTNQSFSVGAWVRVDDPSRDQVVLSQAGANGGSGFSLWWSATYSRWFFRTYSSDDPNPFWAWNAISDDPLVPGQWYHIFGVYDSSAGELRMYVDGVRQTNVDHPPLNWSADGPLIIGRAGTGMWFDGAVDTVQVWQGALSDSDVAYNN